MSANFTKGPWLVEKDEDEGEIRVVMGSRIDSPGYYTAIHQVVVADCIYHDDVDYDEAIANANVMAAAPLLYEALASLDSFIDFNAPLVPGEGFLIDGDNPALMEALKQAADALRAARGEG